MFLVITNFINLDSRPSDLVSGWHVLFFTGYHKPIALTGHLNKSKLVWSLTDIVFLQFTRVLFSRFSREGCVHKCERFYLVSEKFWAELWEKVDQVGIEKQKFVCVLNLVFDIGFDYGINPLPWGLIEMWARPHNSTQIDISRKLYISNIRIWLSHGHDLNTIKIKKNKNKKEIIIKIYVSF